MSNHICKICGDEVTEFRHFWSKHKVTESDYWMLYHPRYSKTGKKIPFRNREQYLDSEFVDKNDLKTWVKSNEDCVYGYLIDFLGRRLSEQKNIYLPSQVESRTLMIPSVQYIQEKICDYDRLVESGLKKRFDYGIKSIDELKFVKSLSKHTLIIDTREQRELDTNIKKEQKQALKFGDYSCTRNPFSINVERKSLPDLISTISGGYERFQREIDRAKEAGAYLFIICEATFNDLSGFKHGRKFRAKVKFGPDFIFHRMRELMQKNLNIQFVFSGSRKNSSSLIELIYKCKDDPRNYDWQFLIDSKIVEL